MIYLERTGADDNLPRKDRYRTGKMHSFECTNHTTVHIPPVITSHGGYIERLQYCAGNRQLVFARQKTAGSVLKTRQGHF